MIVAADARRIPLPDESVQCVVTSPPYWGLRKYKGEQELIWENQRTMEPFIPTPENIAIAEGILHCREHGHEWTDEQISAELRVGMGLTEWSEAHGYGKNCAKKISEYGRIEGVRSTCTRCGAWRGAYGLEPTVEMYVAHTVEILREIRRVLRKDGVVFWNVGDSYFNCTYIREKASDAFGNAAGYSANQGGGVSSGKRRSMARTPDDLKMKDLCLIPARVALAAQADVSVRNGKEEAWWVRSLIIWAKPNPMPESVTDRPTDAYEHIIMLTKSERYFWDQEAVREPKAETTMLDERTNENGKRRDRDYPGAPSNGGTNLGGPAGSRNMRNVWTFPTQPYSGAHFATFPEEIPRRAILAGTSARGACAKCGAPWKRIVEPSPEYAKMLGEQLGNHGDVEDAEGKARGFGEPRICAEYVTIGWEPICECGGTEETVACLVVDPFGGSGTTARVAIELNRRAVLFDLAYHSRTGEPAEYAELARERTTEVQRTLPL